MSISIIIPANAAKLFVFAEGIEMGYLSGTDGDLKLPNENV